MSEGTENVPKPPTVVEHDGWELTSSSLNQPTKAEALRNLAVEIPTAEETEPPADAEPPVSEPATAPEDPETSSDEPGATDKPEPKKKSARERDAEIKARIAAETRAYHDARRAREWEESQVNRLRQEREALAKPAEKKAETPSDDVKPEWSKYEADDKSYDTFLDDRDAWNRREMARELATTREKETAASQERDRAAAYDRAESAYEARLQTAIEKYPELLTAVKKNLGDVPDSPFLTSVVKGHEQGTEVLWHLAQHPDDARVLSTLEPSRYVRDAVRLSKTPVELLAYFAQNPQECDRLSRLHPASALLALGELQVQLRGAKDGSPPTNESVSRALPPTRPVVGARAGAQKDSGDLPFGPDWIAAENRRERERKKSAYL